MTTSTFCWGLLDGGQDCRRAPSLEVTRTRYAPGGREAITSATLTYCTACHDQLAGDCNVVVHHVEAIWTQPQDDRRDWSTRNAEWDSTTAAFRPGSFGRRKTDPDPFKILGAIKLLACSDCAKLGRACGRTPGGVPC